MTNKEIQEIKLRGRLESSQENLEANESNLQDDAFGVFAKMKRHYIRSIEVFNHALEGNIKFDANSCFVN